jgi:spore coat protein U-like protein
MTAAGRLLPIVLMLLCGASRLEAACTVSATAVSFGTYDVFVTTPNTSTGTITYHCGNKDRNIQIAISKGSSTTFSPRTLRNGAETLAYNLYRDAAFSVILGDGTGGTGVFADANPPNNLDVNLTVYGRIPAQQDVSVGSYSDTVIVTISF